MIHPSQRRLFAKWAAMAGLSSVRTRWSWWFRERKVQLDLFSQ